MIPGPILAGSRRESAASLTAWVRYSDRGELVGRTSGHIGAARRRYRLLDSVLWEYGILTACGDEERSRRYQRKYGPVVGEPRHEQRVVAGAK